MASKRVWAVGVLAATLTGPAAAASQLEKCREIAEPSARLACYDSVSGAAAPEDPDERVDRQTRQFGLTEQQKAPEDRKEVEQVSAKITAVGGGRVTLENGMVWKVTDGSRMTEWLLKGQVATIRQGLFSGYRMTVDGVTGKAVVVRMQ
jgi:hypothetical protein